MSKAEDQIALLNEIQLDRLLSSSEVDEGVKDMIRKGKEFAKWAVDKVDQAKQGLKKEKQETKDMVRTFFRKSINIQKELHL